MASDGRRRALVVTCNFPPDAAVGTMRTLRLVRHLARTGWTVDVLTLPEHGLRAGAVIDRALLEKVPPEVEVIRPAALRPFDELGNLLRGRRTAAGPVN